MYTVVYYLLPENVHVHIVVFYFGDYAVAQKVNFSFRQI